MEFYNWLKLVIYLQSWFIYQLFLKKENLKFYLPA